MAFLKRFLSTTLIGLLLAGIMPITAGAVYIGTSAISIDYNRTVANFNPIQGPYSVYYTVIGPDPAVNVGLTIYKVMPGSTCLTSNLRVRSIFVGTQGVAPVVGGQRQASTISWNGYDDNGASVQSGAYCFQLRWSNPPIGANGVLTGDFNIVSTPVGPGGGNQVPGGNNNGGANPPANPTAGACVNQQPQPDLCHYASPNTFDPNNLPAGGGAVIYYNVNRRITQGLTLSIRNSNGTTISQLSATGLPVEVNSYHQVWPGTWVDASGRTVKAAEGTYRYVFSSVGRDIVGGSGDIYVRYQGGNGDNVHMNVSNLRADPSPFNPANESTRLYFDLNRNADHVTVNILNAAGAQVRRVFPTINDANDSKLAGTNSVTWSGIDVYGYRVAAGTYRFRVTAVSAQNGNDVRDGTVTVAGELPPPGQFIVGNPTVSPSVFRPSIGERATLTYTIGKTVRNFRVYVRNSYGNVVATLRPSTMMTAGTYSDTWNGIVTSDNPQHYATEGTYTFVLVADGENQVTINVTVQLPAQNPPVITDVGPTPNPFNPATGTTLRYQVNQDACVDVVVYNGNRTISRPRICSNSQNNAIAGQTTSAFWDGRDINTGYPVPADGTTYTYTIQARNRNGVATTRTGTVTAVSNVPPPPQNLVILDAWATPNPFNPVNGTTFSYTLNQDACVGISIYRNNTFIRSLSVFPISNLPICSINSYAGRTNTMFWDGRDSNGYTVPSDGTTYTYTVRAQGANGTTAQRSGTVTAILGGNPVDPMNVYNLYATPDPFDPVTQNTTSLWFTLNYAANVTVGVYRSDGTFVKPVGSPSQSYDAGSHSLPWNGTDQNNYSVVSGSYYFKVEASSAAHGNDTETKSFTVSRGYAPPYGNLQISNVYASPNPFNPDRESTTIHFGLNYDSYVTVTISRYNDGTLVRTLKSNEVVYAGNNITSIWSGTEASEGTYNYKIEATTINPIGPSRDYSRDNASYTGTVSVTRNDNPPGQYLQITDNGANPNPFNPQLDQFTSISFGVNLAPSSLSVKVYRDGNTLVRELPIYTVNAYSYRAEWTGRDYNNNYVADGTYTYKIYVSANGQSQERTGTIYVGNGRIRIIIPTPTPYPRPYPRPYPHPYFGNCGGFSDVNPGNRLCDAIQFVKDKGIFVGYADGTIGLNRVIQRAEMLAVMQKAFGFPLDYYDSYIDGNLGYSDLTDLNAWYMPFIKTFSRRGLMVGYPDGQMRPGRTMNTAELFLTFLKSAKKSPYSIANYIFPNHLDGGAPYRDTPITNEAMWYLKYAFFAKLNDLVPGDYFHPARGITRGQVIKLVYDTYKKGLISYNMPIIAEMTY